MEVNFTSRVPLLPTLSVPDTDSVCSPADSAGPTGAPSWTGLPSSFTSGPFTTPERSSSRTSRTTDAVIFWPAAGVLAATRGAELSVSRTRVAVFPVCDVAARVCLPSSIFVVSRSARRPWAGPSTKNSRSISVSGLTLSPQLPSPKPYEPLSIRPVAVPFAGVRVISETAKSSRLSPHDVAKVPVTKSIVFQPGTSHSLGKVRPTC